MATPQPKSYEQILGDMLRAYQSKTGINDLNTGSAVTAFYETVALAIARSSGDVFQLLRDLSVDRARGDALRKISQDEGLRELPARVANGEVTITDTSFVKISTKVYAGANAPNIGSTTVLVADASLFSSTGAVYIGRGTPNVEGPISYTAKTQIGAYWSLTLSSPTTKFHNINESVIFAQGGVRNIPTGTVVLAPASGASPDVKFSITQSAVILDGETQVAGVPVSAQEPGTVGNVPIGSIKEFTAEPFSGASVSNPLPLKTGRDVETDDELRIRIKRTRLSRGLGTALAVKNAVIGATPSDENATVVSSEIITGSDGLTTLFVDDGTGYEPKTSGVGVEVLVDSAIGGESHFQLKTGGRQTSVSKAFLITNLKAPFDIKGDDRLAISVGGETVEHTFSITDFVSPGGATAYEVVASINSNTELNFSASTAEGGTKVIFFPKTESKETIQIQDVTLGRNASELLGLPSNAVETLRLFKNKQPLTKDGFVAAVSSAKQADWSTSIATGDTLALSVDGTSSIIYTITDSDFLMEGTYTTVASGNSLESWVNVFNKKLTGITASIVGERITLISNLDESDRASVEIDTASTLVTKGMFTSVAGLSATGQASDYELSRNTAQIRLKKPLSPGDTLTAGTQDTEARLESSRILGGTVTLAADGNFWLLTDDLNAEVVLTGVVSSTVLTVSKPAANIIRYSSTSSGAFSNVQEGDYVIIWSQELSLSNRIEGRVKAVTSLNLDIKVTSSEYASVVAEGPLVFQEGLVILRTTKVPQKFRVSAGIKTLGEIADELNDQALDCKFSVFDDEILVIKTLTKTDSGSLLIATVDTIAKSLSLPVNQISTSNESLYAFYESGYEEGGFPLFVHSDFITEASALPPDSYISSITTSILPLSEGLDPSFIVGYLQPYSAVLDALSPSETTPLASYSGSSITIAEDSLVKRLRTSDRWYAANPLDFGHSEDMVVVLDGDASGKTFSIPLYRSVKTNTTLGVSANSFNAYDLDAGSTASFLTYFPPTYSFDNYKVLMRAKEVLDPSGIKNAILYRATQWGRSGEKVNIGYIYPTAANAAINGVVTVTDTVNVKISLNSGIQIPTTIDGTTEWDVTVTPNTPSAGTDQVTYSWTGTGTAPNLAALSGGECVNIVVGSQLDSTNLGTFRISTEVGFAPTASSFTVARKNGEATPEANKATLVPNVFSFYASAPTTALDVVDYVNANLSDFLEATLVLDSDLTGTGTIDKSTFEESGFVYESVSLKDGINWISSSDLTSSPQFTFKNSLTLPSTTGYAFNDGEEIRFIPTNLKQLVEFLNILAVTGYTTLGKISATQRNKKLELSTNILGGSGSLQIVGGQANKTETPILGSSTTLENQYVISGINKSGIDGIHSDQWVKIEAANKQKKNTLFKSSVNVRIEADQPIANQSIVSLSERTITDRHFGKTRNHIRTRGRTFKVERQGSLTCFSWDKNGTQPFFEKTVNLDDSLGGTLNVEKVSGTSEVQYRILSGATNFTEVSIGDLVNIQNMSTSENNGTFLVTGISLDGTILRVLNPAGINQFSTGSFTITDNANISGDDFSVNGNTVTAGVEFLVGATADDSAQNLASVISAFAGVSATASANVVTVVSDTVSASIPISYTNNAGSPGATVSGAFLVGSSFSAGDFSCTTEMAENDTIEIGSPFSILNQGKFRIIRRYENSFYVSNPNSVEELVSIPYNDIDLEFDSTTEFDIDASENKIKLIWTGTGTEPALGNAKMGDELAFGTDFSANNQGFWMVSKAEPKLKEITKITIPQASLINGGERFHINAAEDSTLYYVWYRIDGIGVDPAPIGRTGIQVNINSTDSAAQVASATSSAISLVLDFTASVSESTIRVTNTAFGPSTDAENIDVTGGVIIEIIQQGQRTFLEAVNALAISESGILITNILECHRPPFLVREYEATVSDDSLIIASNFLGNLNRGSWKIAEVLSESKIIVTGTMVSLDSASLAGNQDNLIVEERIPFSGYKKIYLVTVDPSSILQRGIVLFDTRYQADKINEAAGSQISAIGKLAFSEIFRKGLDSYRFDTGIIGEANRIVYGEPRDAATYPGVAAAGAEVFIRPPLIRRVKIGVAVRLETGIPFTQIVEQVRTNVSALIDGNPIGTPIAISDIVSTVNSIPGVRAMAITSPLYNASNDTINIGPSEKAKIIDLVNDISTTQIA